MTTTMKKVVGKTFDEERALYNLTDATVTDCIFDGPKDGESVLKESRRVSLERCSFSLRYPLWHTDSYKMTDCYLDAKTRAALWYCNDGNIVGCGLDGIKALRECGRTNIERCIIHSPEFGWRCNGIKLVDCVAESEYFLFECRDVELKRVRMSGKYSFQYIENMTIEDCYLDTKDAFWHTKNVTVKNSTLKGEYLGWYSEGLTLENCRIIGTQPLCYCKNLKLINCTMINCDLSFEYSEVNAVICGHVDSIKNPNSGKIIVDSVGEIIKDGAVEDCNCVIKVNGK